MAVIFAYRNMLVFDTGIHFHAGFIFSGKASSGLPLASLL